MRRGRNRTRESRGSRSKRHPVTAQLLMRTAARLTAQARGGKLLTPAPGSFSLPVVGCSSLGTCLLVTSATPGPGKAWRRQAPEQLERSHLHCACKMEASGLGVGH